MMNDRTQTAWMSMIRSAAVGVVLVAVPAAAQLSGSNDEPLMRTDNRGPGSLNSGPGSMHSGRDSSGGRGGRVGDDVTVAQAGDVRQEDRQKDRREDRREDRRSNTGGNVRGLDRAEQVGGEHGREGRDNARAAQMDRPNRMERAEHPQRPERPERPQRPERPERPERPGHN